MQTTNCIEEAAQSKGAQPLQLRAVPARGSRRRAALLLLLGALAAPLLAPHDPNESIFLRDTSGNMLSPPYPPGTPGLPLGSDMLYRDMWSRLLYGARYTLLFAGIATLLRMLIGTTLGMLAGWYRGTARLVEVLTITWSAVPSLFFALGLILMFFRGADLFTSTLLYLVAVSFTGWAEVAVRCQECIKFEMNTQQKCTKITMQFM